MRPVVARIFVYLMVCLTAVAGCAKKETPPSAQNKPKVDTIQDVSPYFPAEPQLTWEYEGFGNEYAAFTRKVLYRQGNRVQMSENNGGTVMGLVFDVSAQAVTKTFSVPEFYDERNILNEKANLQEVILKAPLRVGESWQNDGSKREVVSTGERVEVPAGKFEKVVKIKITPLEDKQDHEQFEYYAENTGLIMREFIAGDSRITSKLKSFKKTETRPKTKKGTIGIEGTEQEFVINLLDGSPLPFYTYVPGDMAFERVSSGEGDAFLIHANFAGKKREDAYMRIFFYPEGTSVEQAVKFANSIVLSNRWQKVNRYANPDTDKIYAWSESEWHFMKGANNRQYLGSMAVGKHENRTFYVLTHYPEDFTEGFIPRVHKILDEFVWTDTNEKLNSAG
ncbi:MAG: hypothetical protein ACOY3U_13100 [Bacillota bacterium]